ncbi:bifunctional phosphoribosyl-AMP cyclohydrolase/phosphoribosyl-ATP diphosphatase HisIE [Thermomonas sp.]|uniref:bifunctional phosphoribosyl-AMP cyclohydrolase/phosphoribosyl-ATP diphosphatase HisIE n=1 Tax=Thermomonas sp. TaxID=1971895 RepID=UPI001AC735B5|nr:bifunctional phosphoribosyl-AMP cyclohydrolase/phosphoribosyl-ATP diphosphatase HisIE [Xanthomonadales bacterium]MBN8795148.1 bifunctional phosphoribosyl-AMP cyclohydrolase/phosphoribosyl-ATP diphosphatase HisIE [Stenotrophomonas nitritireducens]
MSKTGFDIDALAWDRQGGLLPAIVQDAATLRVLMLGYMDRAALQATLASGRVTFYSRSRQRLWTKGESSGHVLALVSVDVDCDADTLLVQARPHGPTCHLGRASCFPEAPGDVLSALDALIARRAQERPQGSYTTRLFEAGIHRIAQKVGEEGVETALAAVAQDDDALLGEASDLLYHLLVLLRARGLGLDDARRVLAARRN